VEYCTETSRTQNDVLVRVDPEVKQKPS
jgi:hypothetical protein